MVEELRLQGFCRCEGRPMTTGAHEVTTVDELQHSILFRGGDD